MICFWFWGRLAELGALREKLKRQIEHAKTLEPEEPVEEDADAAEPVRFTCYLCPHKEGPPKTIISYVLF